MAITTALGPEKLAVGSVPVQEQISRLFQIEAELASEDGEIDFDNVIGQRPPSGSISARTTSAISTATSAASSRWPTRATMRRYRATIVPWLWFLTRTSDCRIFQNKTVPDIIEEVFQGYGFTDYKLKLTATYPKWEYCVQYRETDFNFVSRLMEAGGHLLFLPARGWQTHAGARRLHQRPQALSGLRRGHISRTGERRHRPGSHYRLDDGKRGPAGGLRVERFRFQEAQDLAARFLQRDAQIRQGGIRNLRLTRASTSIMAKASAWPTCGSTRLQTPVRNFARPGQRARALAAGCTFKLKKHPRADQNREYLITEVYLQAEAGEYAFDAAPAAASSFRAASPPLTRPSSSAPPRLTPKPIVQGPQTAIVVGPSGEEIYTDEYGRVKVQFHWDRHGKSDENSSCWIRVSQFWAGKKWGAIHIPRIGQEVIVEFLEGDPDQPIITGRVYNADQMPPYALPANKTQSGVKSRSSKGGGTANFNEIRFEDKKGSEKLTIHAEKDQEIGVENDETHWVGHDRQKTIDHDETTHVKHDRTETVDNNETITIHGNRTGNRGQRRDHHHPPESN